METSQTGGSASQGRPGAPRFSVRAVLSFLVIVILLPLVLFLAAWRFDWVVAWAYVIIHIAITLISRVLIWRANPDLLAERGRYADSGVAQGWDRLLLPLTAILGPLLVWIVAGLDERLSWSPNLPVALQVVAAVLLFGGYVFSTWAMTVNAYFSAVVRVQADRGQTVVTTGPYRLVRHPGYAGGALVYLTMPLMLDSLWALLPAVLTVALVVVRTAMEDRLLQSQLPGYTDYARRTRYRLLPGIW